MKKAGKIAGYTIYTLLIFAMVFTWCWPRQTEAATIGTHTFILPSTSGVTHSANTYIIIYDLATGNLVAQATGTVSASNAWGDADIATSVHSENGLIYEATIPDLSDGYAYAMAIFDSASPAKTDVPTMGPFLYDPVESAAGGSALSSDTNPRSRGAVKTRNAQ